MPVSYLPVFITFILVIIPVCVLFTKQYKMVGQVLLVEGVVVWFILAVIYIPGGILWFKAAVNNDAKAQYELSRWESTHIGKTNSIFLIYTNRETHNDFTWLEKSANNGYIPAIYALGVRYKYGEHVPEPENWGGPGGNVFSQPEKGQPLIDKAIKLGYKPTISEEYFYYGEYRN